MENNTLVTLDTWKFPYDLRRRGQRDAIRHSKRVKDAIKKRLRDLIAEESIIVSDGKKKVKIPLKYLDQYRFKYGGKRNQGGTGQGLGDVGDVIGHDQEYEDGDGPQAGDQPGERVFEAEIEIEDLVKMMLEELDLPWLEEKERHEIKSVTYNFNDIRKKGAFSNLDKRLTLKNNIKRNAMKGNPSVKNINDDDLRFKVWQEQEEYHSNAVIFLCLDRSGSMTTDKKYIAKAFFFWMARFLRIKYERVEIVFIAHDTEAQIVPEKDFFTISNSGGTMASSAYDLCLKEIDAKYPQNKWNIYVMHFSDGDNWGDDNKKLVKLVRLLLDKTTMFGYGEIADEYDRAWYASAGWQRDHTLYHLFEAKLADISNFMATQLESKHDIWKALEYFFKLSNDIYDTKKK